MLPVLSYNTASFNVNYYSRHIDDENAAEAVAAAASWSSLTNFLNAIPMFFYQFLPMFGGKKRL